MTATAYTSATPASCLDADAAGAQPRPAERADPRAERIAVVKAAIVQAMRFDRADEVAELRAELAALRGGMVEPVKDEEE